MFLFTGGTEVNNQQFISEGNTAYSLFTGGTEVNNQQSISEGNTACSLFTGGTEVNNQQSISEGNTLLRLFSNLIYKKNDNRYERVQKIDPRNTLRGMKTKETIFSKIVSS